jgi:hypothetical protein
MTQYLAPEGFSLSVVHTEASGSGTMPLNLQARFLKVRARVPMYRLFLTIFLGFG